MLHLGSIHPTTKAIKRNDAQCFCTGFFMMNSGRKAGMLPILFTTAQQQDKAASLCQNCIGAMAAVDRCQQFANHDKHSFLSFRVNLLGRLRRWLSRFGRSYLVPGTGTRYIGLLSMIALQAGARTYCNRVLPGPTGSVLHLVLLLQVS